MWLATNATVCCLTLVQAWLFIIIPHLEVDIFEQSFIFLWHFPCLFIRLPLPKYRYTKNVLPRSCSVLGSATALPFSFLHKLIACLVILVCWIKSGSDNSMRMCLQKSPHSFLSLYYFTKQTGSFIGLKSCSFPKLFFFFWRKNPHWVGAGITSRSWSRLGGNSSLTHFLFALLPVSQKSKWKDNGRKGLLASCRGLVSWKQIGRRAVRPPTSSHQWWNANVSEKCRIFKGPFPNLVSLTKYRAVKNARVSSSGLVPFFRFLFSEEDPKAATQTKLHW